MKKYFAALLLTCCCSVGLAADRNADSFKTLDGDSDGKLTQEEFSAKAEDKDASAAEFKKLDKDGDSSLTEAEYTAQ